MNHPGELLSAYLDGELEGKELSRLLGHLSGCGRCSADLEDLQRVRSAVRSLPVFELPRGLIPEIDDVVVPLHRQKGIWVGVAAAVVAAVIAVAALVAPGQSGTVSVEDLNSRFGARVSLDPAFGPAKVGIPPGLTGE